MSYTKKYLNNRNTFYCFSPPVMLATFIIEISLAIYVLIRYRINSVTRLAIALLVFLATFQLAEYMVCEGAFGLDSLSWARMGYVAITFLPPLGIHLGLNIIKVKNRKLLLVAYGSAIVFGSIFALAGQGIGGHMCLGNYVIFKIASWATLPFAIYYYGWMAFGMTLAVLTARRIVHNIHRRQALYGLAIGYAAFIIPTTTANIINPATIAGIPSIMCGFAVLMALTLAFWVVPDATKDITEN